MSQFYYREALQRMASPASKASKASPAEEAFADYVRIQDAIRRYAYHHPLDVKTPLQLRADLLAICGDPHRHQASLGNDSCLMCGRDLQHEVHK